MPLRDSLTYRSDRLFSCNISLHQHYNTVVNYGSDGNGPLVIALRVGLKPH